jgi:hypothetical protein
LWRPAFSIKPTKIIESKMYNEKLDVFLITFACFLLRGRISVSLDMHDDAK